MDRIRALHPPGTPRAEYPDAPGVVDRLLRHAVPGPDSCLIWIGSTDRDNYGVTQIDKRRHRVHRVVYKLLVGPAVEAELVDHACHNKDRGCPGGRTCLHRRCLNPHHLELATPKQNLVRSTVTLAGINARKTHCKWGHEFSAANTYVTPGGKRMCRTCLNARMRAYHARVRAASGGAR